MANITPLWASSANGTPITICTAFGTKTITIDDNGQEIPTQPHMNKRCTMCLVSDANVILQQSPHIPKNFILKSTRCALKKDKKNTINTFNAYIIRGPPSIS